ncbi:NYN domain-containing protein [Candidatus Margulisiibacteriota bacterium]
MAENKPQLWVDGYNLLFADEYLKELTKENIQAAARMLIEKVAEYAAANALAATIFFDNKNYQGPVQEEEYLGVRIISGSKKESADDLIEKMSFNFSGDHEVVLITSDNLLQQLVANKLKLVRIVEANRFNKLFQEMRERSSGRDKKNTISVKLVDILKHEAKSFLEERRHGRV